MLRYPIVQLAYFVNDVRASAERFARQTGAGPFFVIPEIQLAWGEPNDFLHSSAYGQWGEVMVEFVQQDREGPSPFRDLFSPGQEGLHHVAMMVTDLPTAYREAETAGLAVAWRAATENGTEFAFADARATSGHFIELYEGTAALRGFYQMVRDAADGWDGADPVRELT